MTANTSDLSDDIVQDLPPQHVAPTSPDFAPWHKVRKQFIRVRQWNWLIKKYIVKDMKQLPVMPTDDEGESVQDPHDGYLRCLTIPGDDLLDLRSLWNDIQDTGCRIRYLGFNSRFGSNQTDTRVHLATNDLNSMDRVARDSSVVHGPFQSIRNVQSQAYGYLRKYGPFNVVNLDLCDSLFPSASSSGGVIDYLDAIYRLIEYQMQHQRKGWLLFITTEVAPDEVDHVLFEGLCRPTISNCLLHKDFAEQLESLLTPDAFNAQSSSLNIQGLSAQRLVDLFGVALGKTLLKYCNSSDQAWKVTMLTSHRYSINPEKGVSMLSLAYDIRPIFTPPTDPTGLSTITRESPPEYDELQLALKMIERVKDISDVDELLAADGAMHATLLTSSADLLELAGYDREEYMRWVSQT